MAIANQNLNNKRERMKAKYNYTYLSPIFEYLDGCTQCKGTYFSSSFNDLSNCKCNCHNKNILRLISDNERIVKPTALAEESWQVIENGGGDPDVYL